MESGGERGPSARLPLAARRRPPDSVPSAAPSGRRREPPRSSRCGAQRPRRQLPLSHHLAVTASQKPSCLAAAGARDGRGPAPRLGGVREDAGGWRGPRGGRAGRGRLRAGRGDAGARGLGSRRREAGRACRPHPPPAAFNGPARTLGLGAGGRSGLRSPDLSPEPRPDQACPALPRAAPRCLPHLSSSFRSLVPLRHQSGAPRAGLARKRHFSKKSRRD